MNESEQRQFVRDNYDKMPVRHISKAIGRSRSFIIGQMKREGLQVPLHVKKRFIQGARFYKGHVPWTKGRRMSEFMSSETIQTFRSNQFKKGDLPHNTGQDGDLSIRFNQCGTPYIWIRTGLNNWRHLHRVIWEFYHGEVPEGYNVQFKNGNFLDCGPENLYLVHRSEQLQHNRHGGARLPYELRNTITLINQLKSITDEKQNNGSK